MQLSLITTTMLEKVHKVGGYIRRILNTIILAGGEMEPRQIRRKCNQMRSGKKREAGKFILSSTALQRRSTGQKKSRFSYRTYATRGKFRQSSPLEMLSLTRATNLPVFARRWLAEAPVIQLLCSSSSSFSTSSFLCRLERIGLHGADTYLPAATVYHRENAIVPSLILNYYYTT